MIFVLSTLEAISIRARLVVHLVLRLRWRDIHGLISLLVQIVGYPTTVLNENVSNAEYSWWKYPGTSNRKRTFLATTVVEYHVYGRNRSYISVRLILDRDMSIVLYAIYSDFDVVGIFGRDLRSIHHILSLTHDIKDSNKFPSKILHPEDFFPHSKINQQTMVDKFVGVLENFLGVKAIRFSLAERWKQFPPSEAGDLSITEYLAQVSQLFTLASSTFQKLMREERVLANVL